VNLYYIGPMFRRERPQKGRFRQFYQIGAEVLGGLDVPTIDAEVIELVMAFIEKCGLRGCALHVNSIGCPECRPKYVELLRRALTEVKDRLGPDSQRRIETNPLRVLDSKVEGEQPVIAELPSILDHLCDACREHFAEVRRELEERKIKFEINHRLVRGLDYYTRTTFEITAPGLGAQDAVCGGGRYDGLSELLGGPPTKGMGWALGTDRLLLALEAAGAKAEEKLDCFVIWLGPGRASARALAQRLRHSGATVELLYEEMKLGKALERADRLGARYAILVGEDEVAKKKFTLRDLASGRQQALSEDELVNRIVGTTDKHR
jgi:histidyl-tRNA synthetase